MELKLIERLVRIMQKGEVTELEVDDSQSGLRVRLRRGAESPPPAPPVVHVTSASAPAAPSPPLPSREEAPPAASRPPPSEGVPFPSPMVGTFYRAPSPDAEPFVSPGSAVKPDTVVCIIEAMKVMNEIRAETSGEILEVLAENGDPVEFGQPLFLIRPA